MEVLPIMTVTELEDLTINEELLNICQSQPYNASKIITQVSIKIRNKIDKEIFHNPVNWEYEIPDDLKYACASLCECYYTYAVKEKGNSASKKVVSERIDDYSYTYSDSQSAYTFFGIPTDSDIIAIIESYSWIVWKGYWGINLH